MKPDPASISAICGTSYRLSDNISWQVSSMATGQIVYDMSRSVTKIGPNNSQENDHFIRNVCALMQRCEAFE